MEYGRLAQKMRQMNWPPDEGGPIGLYYRQYAVYAVIEGLEAMEEEERKNDPGAGWVWAQGGWVKMHGAAASTTTA